MAVSTKDSFTTPSPYSKKLKERLIIIGKVKKARRLDMAVSEIESAKSPFTKTLKPFDVAPPGQAVMIIKPTAICGSSRKTIAIKAPIRGSKIICPESPIRAALGLRIT